MSCYNWEQGTIKIPAAEWAAFRKAVLTEWNTRETAELERHQRLHTKLKEAVKGKRGAKKEEAIRSFFRGVKSRCRPDSLVTLDRKTNTRKVVTKAPKKKDFNIVPVTKSATLQGDDWAVRFDNKTRTVEWHVHENNRAVERAHKDPLVQFLFKKLGQVTWTRSTGGVIVGNDEYNQDNAYEGGGGNYVTRRFSVEEQERQKKASNARFASMNRGFYGW